MKEVVDEVKDNVGLGGQMSVEVGDRGDVVLGGEGDIQLQLRSTSYMWRGSAGSDVCVGACVWAFVCVCM